MIDLKNAANIVGERWEPKSFKYNLDKQAKNESGLDFSVSALKITMLAKHRLADSTEFSL